MKKFYLLSIIVLTSFNLFACSKFDSKITNKTLQKNDWIVAPIDEDEDSPETISFTENRMFQIQDQSFYDYMIEKDKIAFKGKDEQKLLFKLKKENKKIIMTPITGSGSDFNDDDIEENVMILMPK